jgi:hypothetical protein
MLLTDTHILENLQIIEESKSKGTMKIKGIFQRADEANNNQRIYSKILLEREVKKLTEAIGERRLLGELDHPTHDAVKLSNVSHLVTGLRLEGKEVVGEAEILNTPSGKVAQALINDGVKIGISSRGMGTLSEDIKGNKTVNEDFKLITFDLVADPSTRGAFPEISEATSHRTQEIVESTLKTASREKFFLAMLKRKLEDTVAESNGGEPEHLASIRRASKTGQDITTQKSLRKRLKPDPTLKPGPLKPGQTESGRRAGRRHQEQQRRSQSREDSGISYGENKLRSILEDYKK